MDYGDQPLYSISQMESHHNKQYLSQSSHIYTTIFTSITSGLDSDPKENTKLGALLTHWLVGFPVSLLAFPGAVICNLTSIAYIRAFIKAIRALTLGNNICNKTSLNRLLQQGHDIMESFH